MSSAIQSLLSRNALVATLLYVSCVAGTCAAPSGAAPRLDFRTLCPKVDHQLPKALEAASHRVALPDTVTVQFQLNGDRIHNVTRVQGSPRNFRDVRRAVLMGLKCNGGADGPQLVRVSVQFTGFPDKRSTASTKRLVNPGLTAQ